MPPSPRSAHSASSHSQRVRSAQKAMIKECLSRQADGILVNFSGATEYQSKKYFERADYPSCNGLAMSVTSDPWAQVKPPPSLPQNSNDVPRKSCLKCDTSGKDTKTVSFADSHGFALSSVRRVYETTEEPPVSEVLGEICDSLEGTTVNRHSSAQKMNGSAHFLEADFEQPSSDFLKFRQELERSNVCLENLIIKDMSSIAGTIQVKNIAFEKTVFVRVTFDHWKSCNDIPASYVKTFPNDSSIEYDTFQFSITIPEDFDYFAHKIEFCVCYKAGGGEYWDNRNGRNYAVKANVFLGHQGDNINGRRFSAPSTYCELPNPQFNTWLDWERSGPFY